MVNILYTREWTFIYIYIYTHNIDGWKKKIYLPEDIGVEYFTHAQLLEVNMAYAYEYHCAALHPRAWRKYIT